MTVHDYTRLPEGPPHYQLVQGRFHMSPAPNRFHQQIVGQIYRTIANFLETHPLGTVYISPIDVYLTDIDVYQPDIAYVSKARAAILSDRGIEGAPDLLVEVLSPGTDALDKGTKRDIYARTGVKELWLVDPATLTVQIFGLQEDADTPRISYDSQAQITTPLIPGLVLRAAEVFKR
jgi:Uma2 family endonuclease